MKKDKKENHSCIYIFSEEKQDEFKNMPLRSRLQWLEEANTFINSVIGFEKRALFDERFNLLASKKRI